MRKLFTNLLLALSALALPAFSQQPAVKSKTSSSTPGRVATTTTVTGSAVVTAVDAGSRKLSLKSADGENFDLVAPQEVKNFGQIRVGDEVVVEYVRALTLQVRKSRGPRERSEQKDIARTNPGERPGTAGTRTVTIVADVVDVDPAARLIVLKGPNGNTVKLDVQNPEHFAVVRKGDQVEAVYVEALAIAVRPANAKRPAK